MTPRPPSQLFGVAFELAHNCAERVRRLAFVCFLVAAVAQSLMAQRAAGAAQPVEEVFQTGQFARWMSQGQHQDIRWKVTAFSHGLSIHQRMVAHLEIELPGAELVKRESHGMLVAMVQVDDDAGHHHRDFGFIDLKEAAPELHKQTWTSTWEAFAVPGQYTVNVALYDKVSGEHNFTRTSLRVDRLKNDALPELWSGLPRWEFWAPLKELRDNLYRPDIESRLPLNLNTRHRIQVEVLADLTPSDLFRGSARFYSRFLSVALPLVKDLSDIHPTNGSIDVATIDLRQNKVTFEQDDVRDQLNWARLKDVVAPENGPGMINVQGLQQKHDTPDFLRDEVLRRLSERGSEQGREQPFRVFIVVGSPMDFYAFHHFPQIDEGQAANCVVYYLQYEIYGPYATGALGNVRKMLKPLTIHTIKVRTPESVRQALQRIMREAGQM